MSMPTITGLRADVWATSSPTARLDALRSLENHLAAQDGRKTPCQVDVEPLEQYTNGVHYTDEKGVERIGINSDLVNDPNATPYQAVETLFHEDRHAHQHHVAKNPELAENKAQLQDWQENLNGGYIDPPETPQTAGDQPEYNLGFSEYRFQPVEADANRIARARTDELYQDTLQDQEGYAAYKNGKLEELAQDQEIAVDYLGDNYEEEARLAMHEQYQSRQELKQQAGFSQQAGEEPQPTLQEPPVEEKTEQVEDLAQAAASPELAAAEQVADSEAVQQAVDNAQEQAGVQVEAPEANTAEQAQPDTSESQDYQYGYGY